MVLVYTSLIYLYLLGNYVVLCSYLLVCFYVLVGWGFWVLQLLMVLMV